ncbi:MAG: CRISPR-associated endonuclease Cas2 [Synechococcaceae cyanobacterium SM2_3_2]|nr:CRISPR-associated endonuclease Cas2 [Synechococcaceae cyanobacterium SM2_3_2]
MAEHKVCYLICYDIRCPRRWRRAYKLLESYGERIQYSIFRIWLTMREREKLRWQLEQILVAEDSLLIVGICHRCVERVIATNRLESWPQEANCYQTF